MILLVALTVSGCGIPFVPIAANEDPIALTVVDQEVWFRWCGPDTGTFGYLIVEYRIPELDRVASRVAEGAGHFRLKEDMMFSTTMPPAGLSYTHSSSIPVVNQRTLIFVVTGRAEDDLGGGVWATFDSESLTDLSEGQWLYTTGEVSDEPCGMRTAHRD